jgi:hypothetical protein
MENEVEKFKNLKARHDELEKKKIRMEEQFRSKKEALGEVIRKIKEEGYDPTKLDEIITRKKEELEKALNDFEEQLEKASSDLSAIEA